MKNKKIIIAIVGMPGSGKTDAGKYAATKGFGFIRLGQLTLDEVIKRGLKPGEASEQPIREELRKKYGMAVHATLNFPKIDSLLKTSGVVIDGLRSWEEYLEFKKKYGKKITVIAIYASPETRHGRLSTRIWDKKNDPKMINRSYSRKQAKQRDCAEISNLRIGGPIAMADFTIINEDTQKKLFLNLDKILKKII